MNRTRSSFLFGAAIAAALFSWGSAFAAPEVSGFARGAEVKVRGRIYFLLPEVRAAHGLEPGESGRQALGRMSLHQREVVEEKRPFVIFHEPTGPHAFSAALVEDGTFPVLLNPESGGLGVWPGTLVVKLKHPATAEAIASDHQLQLANRFDPLRWFVYRPGNPANLLAALEALRADPRVVSADPEVLEFMNEPH